MPITENDLLKIVGDSGRIDLSRIYRKDGYAIATDGHVAATIATPEPDTDDPNAVFRVISEAISNAWDGIKLDSPMFEPLEIGSGKTTTCTTCGGSGEAIKCPSCDGTGEVSIDHDYKHKGKWCSDSYDHECILCDGTGKIQNEDEKCEDCGGEGVIAESDFIDIAGSRFSGEAIRALLRLSPISIHPRVDGKELKPHPIRGAGWIGTILPMRKES